MEVRWAEPDDTAAVWTVMRELRPHLDEDEFGARVGRMAADGYRLAVVEDDGIVCVAGIRVMEMLHYGKFLYVDDLVTLAARRSKGYGSAMLRFLEAHATAHGLDRVTLDSGVQRADTHRFYEREGYAKTGWHFERDL